MRTLYLDCSMGAAGDMLMAALLELHPQPEEFLQTMASLGLPGVEITAKKAVKCGIQGTHVSVRVHGQEEDEALAHGHAHDHCHDHAHTHDHEHDHGHEHHHHHDHDHAHGHEHGNDHEHDHHHDHGHTHGHEKGHFHDTVAEIEALIDTLSLPEAVRADAKAVYRLIAGAESTVHGHSVEQIHFHEVGSLDAVADVVGVCLLMHQLAPDTVAASPVHVGSGQVRCAHGLLPVPAPATALLLQGVPIYGGSIQGELCTPTGAALLKHFVKAYGPMPAMVPTASGYGMGTRDFPAANCLRATIGESGGDSDEVMELCCNLDDMTGEAVAFACEALLEAGALDVWTAPITMKKGRPAVLLTCLCRSADAETLTAAMLRHTTTLGVRRRTWERRVLQRRVETADTVYGPMRRKISEGEGLRREKWEYEDLAAAARERGVSLQEVLREIGE